MVSSVPARLCAQTLVVGDLEFERLKMGAQICNVPRDLAAVLSEQIELVGDCAVAGGTEFGEALHAGDGHAGGAQPQQEGQPVQFTGLVPALTPDVRPTDPRKPGDASAVEVIPASLLVGVRSKSSRPSQGTILRGPTSVTSERVAEPAPGV